MGQHCAAYLTLGIVLVVFHYALGVELWKPFTTAVQMGG